MSILYEINTRAWLRDLSEKAGHPITIGSVPNEEIQRWDELGFTDIWLMGVWHLTKGARDKALEHWRADWRNDIPSEESDVHGSPYAVDDYVIDPQIGTLWDLQAFKRKLNQLGLALILDFIPNHFAADSPLVQRYPTYAIQAPLGAPGTFTLKTKFGKRTFAHGKDPFFPPWTDTVQLEHRNYAVQNALVNLATTRAVICDGYRCDMAMLVLPEVFEKTWKHLPVAVHEPPVSNFWPILIQAVLEINTYFLFIAEVYWDLEHRLQEEGFDFTYHKPVYDLLMRGDHAQLVELLHSRSPEFLSQSLHFLENHDEPRVASLLPLRRHKAAAFLCLTLPGMPMLHDGQLEGRKAFARIQMSKRLPEAPDPDIAAFYDNLLRSLRSSQVRKTEAKLLKPRFAAGDGTQPVVATLWSLRDHGGADLAVVNLGTDPADCQLDLPASPEAPPELIFQSEPAEPPRVEVSGHVLNLHLPPESGHLIRLQLRPNEGGTADA